MDTEGRNSGTFVINADLPTPAPAPAVTYGYDNVGTAEALYNGSNTDDDRPGLRGTAKANTVVVIHDGNSNPIGSVKADQHGNWAFTPQLPLADGTHNFIAVDS